MARASPAYCQHSTLFLSRSRPRPASARCHHVLARQRMHAARVMQRSCASKCADCARINCAHDGPDVWRAIIRHVRSAARAVGRRCPILTDLAGPKVRVVSVSLAIAPLTPKDLADLDFVAAHADCVGYSFVQRPGRPMLPVVLKVETSLAVSNLPRLIVAAGRRQPAL